METDPAEQLGTVSASPLSDPAALSAIASLLSGASQPNTGESAAPSPAGNSPLSSILGALGGGGNGGSGAVLSSLLSQPAVLSALPGILSALSGAAPPSAGVTPPAEGDERAAFQPVPPPMPMPKGKRPVRPTDRRSALLLALKPYLSHEKAELVDTLVRIMEIFSLIQNLEGKR